MPPVAQQGVDRGSAHQVRAAYLPLGGEKQKRARLRAAEAAVRAYELLEGRDFSRPRIEPAVDHEIACVREGVKAAQVVGRVWAELCEWVTSIDPIAVQLAHSVTPKHHRAMLGRADEHETDATVFEQPMDQSRMRGLYGLAREALGCVAKIDQPKVAGRADNDVA
jgi:hypothetical protein